MDKSGLGVSGLKTHRSWTARLSARYLGIPAVSRIYFLYTVFCFSCLATLTMFVECGLSYRIYYCEEGQSHSKGNSLKRPAGLKGRRLVIGPGHQPNRAHLISFATLKRTRPEKEAKSRRGKYTLFRPRNWTESFSGNVSKGLGKTGGTAHSRSPFHSWRSSGDQFTRKTAFFNPQTG